MGKVQKFYEFRCSFIYILPDIPTFCISSFPPGPYIAVPNMWSCTIRNEHCWSVNKFHAVLQCVRWQLVPSAVLCTHHVIFQCKKVADEDMSFWQYIWKLWHFIFSVLLVPLIIWVLNPVHHFHGKRTLWEFENSWCLQWNCNMTVHHDCWWVYCRIAEEVDK